MPIGYPITTGGLAAAAISAVIRLRPRRSSPFRLSYIFGLWLNWPFVVFLFLVGLTVLAINQTGLGSWGLWIGLCLAIVALVAGWLVLRRRALEPVRFSSGLWTRGSVLAGVTRRSSTVGSAPPSAFALPHSRGADRLSAPWRREAIANIRYGPARS